MHRILATGLAAALAAGPAPADDAPPRWVGRLFGATEPAADAKAAKPAAPQPPLAGPLPAEAVAEALRAEQEALLRRLDVCGRLRQSAAETNDAALVERAIALEDQATALYHQRVARFGVRGGPTRRPDAEARLERALGQPAGGELPKLAPPAPARPATAQARPFREVQP